MPPHQGPNFLSDGLTLHRFKSIYNDKLLDFYLWLAIVLVKRAVLIVKMAHPQAAGRLHL